MKEKKEPSLPWYKEGLRFECTGCGECCTGSPGYVWVNEDEIATMAKHLKLTREEFIRKYTRSVNGKLSLLESSTTYDCVFLKEKKCTIYHARPTQCRTFPWWPENLSSEQAWKSAAKRCEGINKEAPIVAFGIIQDQLNQTD